MKILEVICSKGKTGFYFDDQKAIKHNNAISDGAIYRGNPVTEGFTSVRQPGESISVMLILEDGQIAWGDCNAVQYSGAAGRDPLFLADVYMPVIEKYIKPLLEGQEITTFRQMAKEVDEFINPETGKRIHTAIRYGVTQAILDAVAKSRKMLMAEVLADEYNTKVSDKLIPIFTQSGDDRYNAADKMILKRVPVLPHALINNVETKLGVDGGILLDYVKWLVNRINTIKDGEDYNPVIQLDVYGTIGEAFNNDVDKIVEYMAALGKAAYPYKLRIEGPVDAGGLEEQMVLLKKITDRINTENLNVEIVADEWCNTLEDIKYFVDNKAVHMVQVKSPDLGGINNVMEAILYCKEKGVGAYLGGSCNETERSVHATVHVAMASQADQILARPGMGVDEALMTVYNEMQRIMAILAAKAKAGKGIRIA
jgi:methylaspartate ammonia-lyase